MNKEDYSNSPVENWTTFKVRLQIFPENERTRIDFAYDLAKQVHRGQFRESGERYFEHIRAVALILLDEAKVTDPDVICAALLHDAVEDTVVFGHYENRAYSEWVGTAHERLTPIIGEKAASMIIALTTPKVDGVEIKTKDEALNVYISNLYQASPDTILVKMADRLHNLRTLKSRSKENQKKVIEETRIKYIPLFEEVAEADPEHADVLLKAIKNVLEEIDN